MSDILSQSQVLSSDSESSPALRGWVNKNFDLVRIDNETKRICRANGCTKVYAASSSHTTFKNHWKIEHKENVPGRLTAYLFSNSLHTNRLVKTVIDLNWDYTTVDKESFINFVRSLNPNCKMICRKTLSDIIMSKRHDLAQKITDRLTDIEGIALTFDIWSPRKGARGFGCITGHFVDKQAQFRSIILQFRRIKLPHDGETICKFMERTIDQFKIAKKVVAITTDNASNNIAAVNMLIKNNNIGPVNIELTHFKCVAHIIHLGIQKAMKELKVTINPIRDAILAIHSSRKRKEAFFEIQRTLIAQLDQTSNQPLDLIEDIDHRWNSSFLMIERAVTLRLAIIDLLGKTKELRSLLTMIDWRILAQIVEFLKPFHEVTKRLCVESDCSISVVAFITPKLLDHCDKFMKQQEPAKDKCPAIAKAAEELKVKFLSYVSELFRPVVNIAAVLDPRYKLKGMSEESITNVRAQLRQMINSQPDMLSCSRSSNNDTTFYEESDNEEQHDELEIYLSARREKPKTDVMLFWKVDRNQFPKLSMLARQILPIQATSVSSERVFSVAGNVDTPIRNRLSDESVEGIVLLKSWMKFLNLE